METVIRLVECFIPLVIEVLKNIHPEKTADDHKEIIKKAIDDHFDKCSAPPCAPVEGETTDAAN